MTGTKAIADHHFNIDINKEELQRMNDIYSKIRHTEPLITSDMIRLAEKNDSHFEGLSNSVKTASGIEDKLERMYRINPNIRPAQALLKMKDIVRYTEIVDHNDIPDVTKKTITDLENKGYVHSGTKNYYANPFKGTQYMGMHLNFISPYGSEIELQIHSNESFAAKKQGHALYEQLRSVSCKQSMKEEMRNEIADIHQSVSKPKGYENISDYEMKKNERERIMQERMSKTAVIVRKTENAEIYDVIKNGQKIMNGFEGKFSDGSLISYQNDYAHHRSRVASLTNKGVEISDADAKPLELSPGQVDKIIRHQEGVHENWMQQNIGDADIELLSLVEEQHTTKNTSDIER